MRSGSDMHSAEHGAHDAGAIARSTSPAVRRWFSVRGARRGMKLSAVALALWLAWAVGFLQGSAPSSSTQEVASPDSQQCCTPPAHLPRT